MDLINIDEYKEFASIEGKKNDPQISSLITSCSTIVQNFIGYPISTTGQVTHTFLAYPDSNQYMLPGYDLDVDSVFYIPRGTKEADAVEVPEEDYAVRDTGRLELYTISPNNGDKFKVLFSYPAQDLADIKLATMLLVKHYYKEEFNKTAMGAGGQTVSYQTGKNFPPHVRAILMMHRMF